MTTATTVPCTNRDTITIAHPDGSERHVPAVYVLCIDTVLTECFATMGGLHVVKRSSGWVAWAGGETGRGSDPWAALASLAMRLEGKR